MNGNSNNNGVEAVERLINLDLDHGNTLTWIHQDVTKPTEHDVLFGRGGGVNRHAGNVHFRRLVSEHEYGYRTTSRKCEKTDISAKIVMLIRQLDPPGRFLKNEGSGIWHDVGDEKARNKTSQALRERGPALVSSQSRSQQRGSDQHCKSDNCEIFQALVKLNKPLRVRCKLKGDTWKCVRSLGIQQSAKRAHWDAIYYHEDDSKKNHDQNSSFKIHGVSAALNHELDDADGNSKRAKEDLTSSETDEATSTYSCITDDSNAVNVFRRNSGQQDFAEDGTNTVVPTMIQDKLVRRVTDMSLSEFSSSGSEQDLTSNNSVVSCEEVDGVQALLQLARCGA